MQDVHKRNDSNIQWPIRDIEEEEKFKAFIASTI